MNDSSGLIAVSINHTPTTCDTLATTYSDYCQLLYHGQMGEGWSRELVLLDERSMELILITTSILPVSYRSYLFYFPCLQYSTFLFSFIAYFLSNSGHTAILRLSYDRQVFVS